jgi:steroid 5-alpha reductase family enzyme
MPSWLLFPIVALAVMIPLFTVLWMIGRRIDNYAVVDVGWSYSFALVALLYLFLGQDFTARALLITAAVVLWSLRLGTHLYLNRIKGRPEEGRYQRLRQIWADNLEFKFLIFFQMQALSVVVLSLPFLLVALDPSGSLGIVEIAAITLGVIAIGGEGVADQQLHRFISKPENKGKVCKQGLWRYSRHPNYFFESLIWVAFALLAVKSQFGWLAFLSPLIIWFLIIRVTGIPPTEAQSLRGKGDAYRQYQRETSAFFPLPPKQVPTTSPPPNPKPDPS